MTLLKPILFLISLLFILSSASAVSITPVRFNETLQAGTSATFTITIQNSTPAEHTIGNPTITGDCAGWITIDGEGNDLPITREFTVSVPTDAVNGWHRCDIEYLLPGDGMIRGAVAFPVSVNVTGGTEPTPTTEPSPTTPPTQTASPTATPRTTYAPLPAGLAAAAIGAAFMMRRPPRPGAKP